MNAQVLRAAGTDPVVRIVRQPTHLLHTHVLDNVCVVQNVDDRGLVEVIAIDHEGGSTGGGWVPAECLELETSPVWIAARDLFLAKIASLRTQMQDRAVRRQALVKELATKHHLEPGAVEEIHDALERFA